MKKSEIYRKVQKLVLGYDPCFTPTEKLEVLRELFIQEDLVKFAEAQEAKTDAS